MIQILKKFASKLGFDKAIIFTSSSSILGAMGSVVTVVLVIKYLSDVEQGFYYTFGSIVAIQIFFELGLNGIITQYVAHEASNLQWENGDVLLGKSMYLSRLSSLLHFSLKWYLFFATILLITLMIVGFFFFQQYDTSNGSVSWLFPWILLAIGTCLNLMISPIIAFLQGLGKVKEIALVILIGLFFKYALIWCGLILGAKLFVLGMSNILGFFLVGIVLLIKYRKLIFGIWRTVIVEKVHYRKEIFPYQWKIALSWISGYFIFQLFNPVLFATEGPVVAGQMGMTLAALNGILSLSLAWMSTKVPLFSGFIAQKNFKQLDLIFNRTLKQSALINITALLTFAGLLILINFFEIEISGKPLGSRFLDYTPLIFMMIPIFLNHFTSSWATYLRCHKQEPYLVNSIVGGILCMFSTVLLGKYFGVVGVTLGYCILTLLMFPWGYFIYKTKKMKWHYNHQL